MGNENLGNSYFRISLLCSRGYPDAKPGQFVMLRFGDQTDPLLRRPFSIHRLIMEKEKTVGIEILYKVVGKCTQKLSTYKKGDNTDILGPLGNSFHIPDDAGRIFFAAGGVGVAPLVFLAHFMNEKGADLSKYRVFIGGRSKNDLLCENDFLSLGIQVHTTTDDGSAGEKGFVTESLEREIKKNRPDIICACGPLPMLTAAAKTAATYEIPCQVSVETIMACGMGVCLGCAVEKSDDADKYMHVCVDGPVFDTKTLLMPG
ncbi:MAG: dihydroorotate dehydrogenase electron transfer subunit [Desulfobacterales bacterium]|nr:dihydroorotate dehydrogenase electron transfer subunit [Desulfobacterales bacterium]